MDSMSLALFLAAAFFGGLTSGLSGFAMGLVVSGVWLHIIAPDQNALLIVFSLWSLFRPALKPVQGGVPRELGVGVANGLIGGLTGLGGIAVTIWSQLQAGPKDAQRAIFQPVMFATFAMTAISLGVAGAYSIETLKLYALALPVLALGIWAGIKLYGKLDDAAFRRIILILLLVSGLSLIVPNR